MQERAGSGVYQFNTTTAGNQYIGKSVDITRRITEHTSAGKFGSNLSRINMPGASNEALRIVEQTQINRAGGIGTPGLENKINSIAEKFWDDLGIPRF